MSFAHENATHRLQYRDNDFIEQLGPHSLTFSYLLCMRQSVARGPYRDLFTVGYPILFAHCRDREKGLLVDPVLGEFICTPTTWADELDVARRDGTDVRVEFVHSPDVDEVEDLRAINLPGVRTDAGALDRELERVDWEQEPNPEATQDPLNAISGFGAQIEANANKQAAALEDFAFKCEKLEQQIDRLQNPDVWPLKRAARRNRASAVALAKRAKDPTREVVRVINGANRAISTVAAEAGMTIQELIAQNPILARLPYVPAGSPINIVKRRGAT